MNLYDTVDEDTYQKMVRRKLEDEDFVVDDDGNGYVDHGYGDIDDEQEYSDEESKPSTSQKTKKQKKKIPVLDDGKSGKRINSYFIGGNKRTEQGVSLPFLFFSFFFFLFLFFVFFYHSDWPRQ